MAKDMEQSKSGNYIQNMVQAYDHYTDRFAYQPKTEPSVGSGKWYCKSDSSSAKNSTQREGQKK